MMAEKQGIIEGCKYKEQNKNSTVNLLLECEIN